MVSEDISRTFESALVRQCALTLAGDQTGEHFLLQAFPAGGFPPESLPMELRASGEDCLEAVLILSQHPMAP